MSVLPARIAMVSMHTSPVEQPGTADSGGMNIAILSTASALARRGIEVDLLTRASGIPLVREIEPGVTLVALAAGPKGVLHKSELSAAADEFGEAVANLTGREAPRYDLLHAHYWLSGLATLPVALELGLPFVQSFHTVGAMKNRALAAGQAPETEQRVRTEMYLASQASAIVASSTAEVTALIDDVRAPADRLWVIPPGADVDLFTPGRADAAGPRIRALFGIEADRPIITVAGRVQPLKDQELAIRVIAALGALGGVVPVLVIAGEATPGDDDYLATLRATAFELGVLTDVQFVGALGRTDLADLFAASVLSLVPSHSETFGIVALESAASGTPVVAFRGSGLIESVADGVSGVLVDSRDPLEWARAVSALLADPLRLADLGITARHHAEAFTWTASATALLAVYSSLRDYSGRP